MKDFVTRHPLMVGTLLAGILYTLALVLANLYSHYYFLILILAFVIWIGAFVFVKNWRWVCIKCGQEAFFTRNKYCSYCSNIMGLIKKTKIFCPNNHCVDKWDKFCPKCGVSLGEKSDLRAKK